MSALFELKTYQGVTHLKHCYDSSVSLLSQPLFSTRVRTSIPHFSPTFHIVPFAFASSKTWNLEQREHLQLVCDCVSFGNGCTVKYTGSNVWHPSSNRNLVISPISSSESLSAQLSTILPYSHDPSIHLTETKLAVHQNIHILRWFPQDWHLP